MKRVWIIIMGLALGWGPVLAQAETAVYSATFTAPQCTGSVSPCLAPPALINGRDNMINGIEPNQPNTLAASVCADGISGTYHADESLDSVTVTVINGLYFRKNDLIRLDATVWCFSTGTANSLYVYRSNSATVPSWTLMGTATCSATGAQTLSLNFNLGNVSGDQVIRTAFTYSTAAAPCGVGAFNDRDDLVLKVATDTDSDTLPDLWENTYGSCMRYNFADQTLDYDSDGLNNLAEYLNFTNPCIADTDGDGLSDGLEVNIYATNPLVQDTDGDGLNDGPEVYLHLTDPTNPDTDGDGLNDGAEVLTYSTDPLNWDTDGDVMADGWEVLYPCMNVHVPDDALDPDLDGLNNREESDYSTNPCVADTDGDGLQDGAELFTWYTDPRKADTDDDGLTDPLELFTYSTNPGLADTDGDGLDDYQEIFTFSTDPNDPDTDNDGLSDGFEAASIDCLDPLVPNGMMDDDDVDGLENLNELYNLSDPCDPADPKFGRPGGGYFGDGDGNLSIGVPDMDMVALYLSGDMPDYSNVFPPDLVIQDLDGNNSIGVPDLDILASILSGSQGDFVPGTPTLLTQIQPVGIPTVAVGQTVGILMRLEMDGPLARPGFGVVFWVTSGSATLLGGEGPASGYPAGARYDLTNLDGEARMVVQVDAAQSITVAVQLPYDALVYTMEVTLTPEVEIIGD